MHHVADGLRGTPVEFALVEAQLAASTVPLRMKIDATQHDDLALARRFGAVAVQLMPPWRRVVGPDLRTWAAAHRGNTAPITDADRELVRWLEASHYVAQHASWSPSAPREQIYQLFADDHAPEADGYDPQRSFLIRRDGRIVAAGLSWPDEVVLLSDPYEGPDSVADKRACLAAVIDATPNGQQLCVDSHVTERLEREALHDLPGLVDGPTNEWTVIVALPAPGGPAPRPLDASLVPDDAAWVRDFYR
ncbi:MULTISPECIES: hypothetical protein [unclassified Luteococcus]|uniref:hypothetical protein n=1 Tax=unclassified Luteococcus TaxID=2639923 RepID=UPI00313ED510